MRLTKNNARISTFIMILIIVLSVLSSTVSATIINVPIDQPTIQDGIDAAISGDTVLVDEGTYFENIRFFGKDIVVSSNIMLDKDPSHIFNTIIDGSTPDHPDTASVVRIIDSETSAAIIQGFTIRNGVGTTWPDPHGAGNYREGGGILTEFSSPIIQYNYIVNNRANHTSSSSGVMASAGGGGIRSGDGNPQILNNIIMNNNAKYGGGIVLNYAEGIVKNNIIAYNTGGEDFAGSGIWKYKGTTAIIENNTIVYNQSALPGAGVFVWSTTATMKNNIIRGNIASTAAQIRTSSATVTVSNSNVEDGFTGADNIDIDPEFVGNYFYLSKTSGCNDAGAPGFLYNDKNNPSLPSEPKWPSHGTLINDIGAYGGRGAYPFENIIMYADSTNGWIPVDVNFTMESIYEPTSVLWDFGDGNTATTAGATHIYNTNGTFDVRMDISAEGNDYFHINEDYIIGIADTIKVDSVYGHPGESSFLTISAINSSPVQTIVIPVEFSPGLPLKIDSISTVGCRTDYFDIKQYLHYDAFNNRYTYKLMSSLIGNQPELEPGSGPILKIHFTIKESATTGDFSSISLDGYNSYLCEYQGMYLDYATGWQSGEIGLLPCCVDNRGNVNGDIADEIDISDLIYMVSYSFKGGDAPPCMEEADIDGSGGAVPVDISDLILLVAYMFQDGDLPSSCE